jgi:ABC-type nitrate/sulfonate/bicarbonate transport system ATPase subunit
MSAATLERSKTDQPSDMAMPKIDIRGVGKQYGDTPPTLSPIDLAIRENEFVALVGRSGCGKTTLLNMVAGLLEPSSGKILVDGVAVTGPGRGKGVVFQQHALFPWLTARENIEFGARSRGLAPATCQGEATQLLDLIGLSAYGDRYPNQLSGGMQQRVAIARALALDPQILLMDEPFGALDEITRIEMQDELLRVWSSRRKTVIFVTHSLSEALYLADRVIVLGVGPGRIVAEYKIDKTRPRSRIDRSILDLQDQIWEHLR